MIQRIILSGFGGQGVLTAGLIVAEAAVLGGYKATYFPSYGAEMRGGTANCHVVVSDEEIASPVISEADALIAISKPALLKFMPKVKAKGLVLANVSGWEEKIEEKEMDIIKLPFEEMALNKLENSKIANVIMIGTYIKKTGLLKVDDVKTVLKSKFSRKGERVVSLNFQALDMGFKAI